MATVTQHWLGGATSTAQISTITLNNDFDDSETDITVTMTAEDNSTVQTVSITPDGVDESVVAAALQVALAASTDSLFVAVTWTVSTNVVTGTAVTAGVPFYFGSVVTGTGTSTDATGTPNSGANDWNTIANWSGGAVIPTDDDIVMFTTGSYDVLYGLNQSGVSLKKLNVGQGYTGSIGDTANGYYLLIDVASTVDSNTPRMILNGNGDSVWVKGTITNAHITGGKNRADMAHVAGTITTLFINGVRVKGTTSVANGTALTNCYQIGAPSANTDIGDSVTGFTLLELDGGVMELSSDVTAAVNNGAILTIEEDTTESGVDVAGFEQRNGTTYWNAGGNMGSGTGVKIFGGTLDTRQNEQSSTTMEDTEVFGGNLESESGLGNVAFTNNIIKHGGSVSADDGVTITVST